MRNAENPTNNIQIWREADELILVKIPGIEEFRISETAAKTILWQLQQVFRHHSDIRPLIFDPENYPEDKNL